MNAGCVVLVDTKSGFIPNAIKWFTESQFSHSLVLMPNIYKELMCIEAADTGVDMTRFDISYGNNFNEGYQVWNVKIDQSIKDNALQSILSDLETFYGYTAYPWLVYRFLNKRLGRDIKAQDNWSDQGMICSGLCTVYLKACGLNSIFKDYGQNSVTPQDLSNIFAAHPELFELVQSVRI